MGGLDQPTSGRVQVVGKDTAGLSASKLSRMRMSIILFT